MKDLFSNMWSFQISQLLHHFILKCIKSVIDYQHMYQEKVLFIIHKMEDNLKIHLQEVRP